MFNNHSTIYKGRFAPSPTGSMHFGTLIAAVGSYLQAKKNNGQWLIRMEDVDLSRKVQGSDSDILQTLEAFGFEWHGDVIYQSQQTEHYQQALEQLISLGLIFPCNCSRKQLAKSSNLIYPGNCRDKRLPAAEEHALRILANDINIQFDDAIQGKQAQNIQQQCGDFVIKRRDALFAYQLAVVVDDALQQITEVVRGADLLDVTARQIYLQQLLQYPIPVYCHLPLAIDADGNKISKSAGGTRIDPKKKETLLLSVLRYLGQQPIAELSGATLDDIWHWAITHWNLSQVPALSRMTASPFI